MCLKSFVTFDFVEITFIDRKEIVSDLWLNSISFLQKYSVAEFLLPIHPNNNRYAAVDCTLHFAKQYSIDIADCASKCTIYD